MKVFSGPSARSEGIKHDADSIKLTPQNDANATGDVSDMSATTSSLYASFLRQRDAYITHFTLMAPLRRLYWVFHIAVGAPA